jgi:hypothetical protein
MTSMLTSAAARSLPASLEFAADTVASKSELLRDGWSAAAVQAQLDARRWRRLGRAVVRHNAALHLDERRRVALINCGRRSVLASFTAAEVHGLTGWERERIHVLVPAGARVVRTAGIELRVHYTAAWTSAITHGSHVAQSPAAALVLAAATFAKPRPACGILAAGVQQRLVTAGLLEAALAGSPRVRHHALLLRAVQDIEQGAHALSEIDLVRVCRRFGLPRPHHQAVRVEPGGRRRYLDAEWIRRDGTKIAVEVDGALHLSPRRWWDDQVRQNEVVISGTPLLRFPSVSLRTEPEIVASQLRRALEL